MKWKMWNYLTSINNNKLTHIGIFEKNIKTLLNYIYDSCYVYSLHLTISPSNSTGKHPSI
jgi:hypothetical protein